MITRWIREGKTVAVGRLPSTLSSKVYTEKSAE